MANLGSQAPHPVRTLLNQAGMICREMSLAYQELGPTYAALQQAAREIEALAIPAVQPEGNALELRILKDISDELHFHGHGLAAARIERRIHLLSASSPLGTIKEKR